MMWAIRYCYNDDDTNHRCELDGTPLPLVLIMIIALIFIWRNPWNVQIDCSHLPQLYDIQSRPTSRQQQLLQDCEEGPTTTAPTTVTSPAEWLRIPNDDENSSSLITTWKQHQPVVPIQQQQRNGSISDHESSSSRSLTPYWRIVMDPESSLSQLDVPETSDHSRRSSNNSFVRFTSSDASDLCSILDMSVLE